MKNLLLLLFFIPLVSFSQNTERIITGYVTDMGMPLSNANIIIEGTDRGVKTDSKGKYSIETRTKDILVFSYVGMKSLRILIEDVTKTLNVSLYPEVHQLDEVVVQQRIVKSKELLELEYQDNKKLIKTGFGIMDTEKTAYSVRVITGDNLNPVARSFIDALRGELPGMRFEGNSIYLRGRFSANYKRSVIFEVDGLIFTSIPNIPISNIDRVAVIAGLGGANRYGEAGGGGVIIINTKTGSVVREPGTNKAYDRAKLRNNIFIEKGAQSFVIKAKPKYLEDFDKISSFTEAENLSNKNNKIYGSSPYYLLDMYSLFFKKWKNYNKHVEIENLIVEKFKENAVVLKALAYIYESNGNFKDALNIYTAIFKLRPSYGQSYRDLANNHMNNENYRKSLVLYTRYMSYKGLDTLITVSQGIDSIIRTESNSLMNRYASELHIDNSYEINGDIGGTRLLFEWNNSETEFDLQFVNPTMNYFTWSHTNEYNSDKIWDEKTKGYSSEQFIIDGNLEGKWQINIKYFGNKSFDPSYLKVTVYSNYGTIFQKKKLHLFKLSELNVNQELLSIYNKR